MVYQNVVAEYCLVTLQQATESLLGSQRCYSRRVLPADHPNSASGSSRYACDTLSEHVFSQHFAILLLVNSRGHAFAGCLLGSCGCGWWLACGAVSVSENGVLVLHHAL